MRHVTGVLGLSFAILLGCVTPLPSVQPYSGTSGPLQGHVGSRGASEPVMWDISPIPVAGWTAIDLLEEHYPAELRNSGREAHVTLRVCVDVNGQVTEATIVKPDRAATTNDAAIRIVRRYSFMPAWRYIEGSTQNVRPVPACRDMTVWFGPEQLEKSPQREPRLGMPFILDGDLVRVWENATVVPIEHPEEAVTAPDVVRPIPIQRIRKVYRASPEEIAVEFGFTVPRPLYVLATDG